MTSLGQITDCPNYWRHLETASGTRMFDVGANGGGTARLFAPSFQDVIAFEPCRESYDDMVDNTPPNVLPLNLAVSDHTGIVELREATNALRAGQLVTDGPSLDWGDTVGHREVLCITLDEAAREYGQPDAIKVDTEGHELMVLSGATQMIDSHRAEWYIEVHSSEYERPVLETFSKYRTELIRHSGYVEGSDGWREHFYVVAR